MRLHSAVEHHREVIESIVDLWWVLPPTKKRILYDMLSGRRADEIAKDLGIGKASVETSMSAIRKKAKEMA